MRDGGRPSTALSPADRRWLGMATLVAILVYLAYLATHPYPAYGGGLFVETAERVASAGYGLPDRIPGYTAAGIPFAYPPLAFYVAAIIFASSGIDPFTYTLLVPGLVVVATTVPYYLTARELLATAPRAGVATIVYITAPETLQWHISAGGIVRTPAMFLALAGAYVGVGLLRDRDRRWLLPATGLFGLTVLTHPHYTVFFGVTYLVLVGGYDRTVRGLLTGATVGLGGLAIAAPWWLSVGATHGFSVFASAAGTHSGLLGGPWRLARVYLSPPSLRLLYDVAAIVGFGYGLSRGRYVIAGWFLASGYVIGKPRFVFVAGGMLVAVLLFDGVTPLLRTHLSPDRVVAVLAAVCLVSAGTGVAYTSGTLDSHGGATQPAFVDDEDVDAMAWTRANTAESASFVVLGDAAEWFPQRTERTILLGQWGVEWRSAEQYRTHLDRYRSLSRCHTATCLSDGLASARLEPDYVYVPKGHYTVRGFGERQPTAMRASLIASDRYVLRYENEGVLIVQVTD